MQYVFLATWCVAMVAWFYGTRFFLPMWAVGFRRRERHAGYWRKALKGYAVFAVAILCGLAAGGVAELWGGGWNDTLIVTARSSEG